MLVGVRPQQQLRVTAIKVHLQQSFIGQRLQALSTSLPCEKLNQPKLREDNEQATDVEHAQRTVVPTDGTIEDRGVSTRSHDQVVAAAVDDVLEDGRKGAGGGSGQWEESKGLKEGEEEEEEWAQSELTLKKLTSIYLKLSKSRLTGKGTLDSADLYDKLKFNIILN